MRSHTLRTIATEILPRPIRTSSDFEMEVLVFEKTWSWRLFDLMGDGAELFDEVLMIVRERRDLFVGNGLGGGGEGIHLTDRTDLIF